MLPSSATWPGLVNPVAASGSNGTLDQAQSLGDLSQTIQAAVVGTLRSTGSGGDVAWYSFVLDRPALVSLRTLDRQAGSPLVSVLSLYNSDPGDSSDLYDPLGHRLLAQDDGAGQGGDAALQMPLAAGTYYVAVSGSGNRYFNPFVANSGYPGSTGPYGLLAIAQNLALPSASTPVVLSTDPAPNAALDSSPFVLRVDFSAAVSPSSIQLGQNVKLIYNPDGRLGDGNDQSLPLAGFNLSTAGNELQLSPAAPLAPGAYELMVALGPPAMAYSDVFYVRGVKGNTAAGAGADDTPATAHPLGNLTAAGFVQVAGAIGDDPTDPIAFDPNDVDLYSFQVTGPGRYAFTAEVFAGRIGSPLFPGISLFELNPTDGQLDLVAVNDGTFNSSLATGGPWAQPLENDPVLYAGLTAGQYYLAVSSSGNVPNPLWGLLPGTNGIFDPTVSHSGQGGFSTGDYVLNLGLESEPSPPQVAAVTPQPGSTLATPPTLLTVHFTKPVNLQQLVYQDFATNASFTLNAVYVQASDGTRYYPSFQSYDAASNTATFLMLDALPNGTYQLHLSGAQGLADLGGNPLAGNDPSGDFVSRFTVAAPPRGTNGNPLLWTDQEPNDDLAHAQNLGVLFPNELQAGVTLMRDFTHQPTPPADTADYYQFQVLQAGKYLISLTGSGLPLGLQLTLTDTAGNPVAPPQTLAGGSVVLWPTLAPGTYILHVGDWTVAQAATVVYQVEIALISTNEPPPPLTLGPGPAIRIQPLVDVPPSLPSDPSPAPLITTADAVVPPASNSWIVPVSLLSPSPATLPTPAPANVPNDVLFALGAGPVGGIGPGRMTTTPAQAEAYEGLLAQLPPSFFAEALVRLPILVQPADSGTFEELPAGSPAGAVQDLIQRLDSTPWGHAVEFLYRLLNDAEQPPSPTEVGSEAAPEEGSEDLLDQASLAVPGRAGAGEAQPEERAGETPSALSPAVLAAAAVLVYQGTGASQPTRRKQLPGS